MKKLEKENRGYNRLALCMRTMAEPVTFGGRMSILKADVRCIDLAQGIYIPQSYTYGVLTHQVPNKLVHSFQRDLFQDPHTSFGLRQVRLLTKYFGRTLNICAFLVLGLCVRKIHMEGLNG